MSTPSLPYASPHRSAVLTTRGLVCSASPLAGAVGAAVLRDGGNAFDAAIAVAAVEAVTITPMCGVGGEVFALLYDASSEMVWDVTGSGRAPAAAHREWFVERGYTRMPPHGPLAPTVPGEVDAWETIACRFGTRPLSALIAPAIDLAERGYPIPGLISRFYASDVEKLRNYASSRRILTKDGAPYVAGDMLRLPDLARTLQRIADGGADEFYRGSLGAEIAAAVQAEGGLITADDLASHQTYVSEAAARIDYRGRTILSTAPPSQGYIVLEILNVAEGYDLASMGHYSAEATHVLVEATKRAFADRLAYMGDPDFNANPIDELLGKEFAASHRSTIGKRASDGVHAGELAAVGAGTSEDTSYFCVVDADGNAASFIHSLSMVFGSGFIAGDTGVLLNDRASRGFYLDAGHPNAVAPRKRTMNTIQAWMVLDDDGPVLLGGTPGGDRQPSWNVQLITSVLDHGANVQAAVDAPRWNHFPGADPVTQGLPYELRLDAGFDEPAAAELAARGHNVRRTPDDIVTGAAQLIALDHKTGLRSGGTDRRCDGYPVAE